MGLLAGREETEMYLLGNSFFVKEHMGVVRSVAPVPAGDCSGKLGAWGGMGQGGESGADLCWLR